MLDQFAFDVVIIDEGALLSLLSFMSLSRSAQEGLG